MSLPSLTEIFRDFPVEDRAVVLGTIRHCISNKLARGTILEGSVSGDVWMLMLEALEEEQE